MSFARLCNAQALHDEIINKTQALTGKIYLFFDEIQEVKDWEKCINSLRIELNCDIYITGSNAKLLSGELATYLAGRYVEFVIYPFHFLNLLSYIILYSLIPVKQNASRNTCTSEECPIWHPCNITKLPASNIYRMYIHQ